MSKKPATISSGVKFAPHLFQRIISVLFSVALCFTGSAVAEEFFVTSASDIASTLPNVSPGDTLVMANGTWTNQQIQFATDGTSANPITLRAETPGQVLLTGSSSLNISGDWLVADGLRFDGGSLGSNDHVVEFRGSNGEATNSRFTNSAIINYNPGNINTRYFWVSMYGQNNRVDHNYFEGHNHSGVTVTVWRNSSGADFHQIDNNHFADRPAGNGNGWESIRIGTSDESLSDSFTTVENNLFERVDGEIEIISNKSGNNSFRYNTFRESAGTLTLRHGNDNLVEGNFFIGAGKNQSGGVRVIGERQTIINNYFHGLDGRADGAISISAGVDGSALNEYYQVKDAVIAHNSIVDVQEAAITFDHGLGSSNRTLLAEDVTVANNLVRSTADPLFEGAEGANWIWEGNIAFGQSLGSASGTGITVVDPQLVVDSQGLWRLGASSPAINASSGNYASLLTDDKDGQARVGVYDVGADEYSTSSIVRGPLEAGDVGPAWLQPVDPPTIDCGSNCVATQAEGFDRVVDLSGNGNVWVVTSDPDALGGQNIRAPLGDRVDLPQEPHDTLAIYEVEFETTGTYTAYMRGRGFDAGTDSVYAPNDFDVDPDQNTSLTSNGVYDWEVLGTFTVTTSELGVPLEFRIGRREQLADLDAFVFHTDGSLSDGQLNAIFLPAVDPDFNGDGSLDCADVDALVVELAGATGNLDFDLTGDGLLDNSDLDQWLADAGAANLASGNPYLYGDANLNGVVDGVDFTIWNVSKFTQQPAWCKGDFNANGFVDGVDFTIWNVNKFTSSDSTPQVPEPSAACLLVLAALLQRAVIRRK